MCDFCQGKEKGYTQLVCNHNLITQFLIFQLGDNNKVTGRGWPSFTSSSSPPLDEALNQAATLHTVLNKSPTSIKSRCAKVCHVVFQLWPLSIQWVQQPGSTQWCGVKQGLYADATVPANTRPAPHVVQHYILCDGCTCMYTASKWLWTHSLPLYLHVRNLSTQYSTPQPQVLLVSECCGHQHCSCM